MFQIQCKLFVFDKTSQSWVERGRGLLRLNDMASTDDGTLQSRLGELRPGFYGGAWGAAGLPVCTHSRPSACGTRPGPEAPAASPSVMFLFLIVKVDERI